MAVLLGDRYGGAFSFFVVVVDARPDGRDVIDMRHARFVPDWGVALFCWGEVCWARVAQLWRWRRPWPPAGLPLDAPLPPTGCVPGGGPGAAAAGWGGGHSWTRAGAVWTGPSE